MEVDVERFGYINILQDFEYIKLFVVRIVMDIRWKNRRKGSV